MRCSSFFTWCAQALRRWANMSARARGACAWCAGSTGRVDEPIGPGVGGRAAIRATALHGRDDGRHPRRRSAQHPARQGPAVDRRGVEETGDAHARGRGRRSGQALGGLSLYLCSHLWTCCRGSLHARPISCASQSFPHSMSDVKPAKACHTLPLLPLTLSEAQARPRAGCSSKRIVACAWAIVGACI